MKKNAMDENELEAATAYDLAGKLNLIPRFPRNDAATGCIADWLMKLCKGAEVDGEHWTAKHQANWLVGAAVMELENWETGGGLPGLQAIFNRRFSPTPAQVDYQMLPAPEIDCTTCNDNGTVEVDGRIYWCTCDQACLLRDEAPNLVIIMNRPRERREADLARRLQIEAEVTRHLAERKQDAETDQTATIEVPALRRRGLFAMLKDRAGRVLRKSLSRGCGWQR